MHNAKIFDGERHEFGCSRVLLVVECGGIDEVFRLRKGSVYCKDICAGSERSEALN